MPKFIRKARFVEARQRPSGMWEITSPPGLALMHDEEFRKEFAPADAEASKALEADARSLSEAPLDSAPPEA